MLQMRKMIKIDEVKLNLPKENSEVDIFAAPDDYFHSCHKFGYINLGDIYAKVERFLPEEKHMKVIRLYLTHICHLPTLSLIEAFATREETQVLYDLASSKDSCWNRTADFSHKGVGDVEQKFQKAQVAPPGAKFADSPVFKTVRDRVEKIFGVFGLKNVTWKMKRYTQDIGSDQLALALHNDIFKMTGILYLNDSAGGATNWPYYNKEVEPRAGNMALFQSNYKVTARSPNADCSIQADQTIYLNFGPTLHGSNPLTAGSKGKYIIQFMADIEEKTRGIFTIDDAKIARLDNDPQEFAKNGRRKFEPYDHAFEFDLIYGVDESVKWPQSSSPKVASSPSSSLFSSSSNENNDSKENQNRDLTSSKPSTEKIISKEIKSTAQKRPLSPSPSHDPPTDSLRNHNALSKKQLRDKTHKSFDDVPAD